MSGMVSKFFSKNETECGCKKCGNIPTPQMLRLADEIREKWGSPLVCTSGYRCELRTQQLRAQGIPAATRSAHCSGLAMDLRPEDMSRMKEFHNFCIALIPKLGFWMEDPAATPSWAHCQVRSVGKTPGVFQP